MWSIPIGGAYAKIGDKIITNWDKHEKQYKRLFDDCLAGSVAKIWSVTPVLMRPEHMFNVFFSEIIALY